MRRWQVSKFINESAFLHRNIIRYSNCRTRAQGRQRSLLVDQDMLNCLHQLALFSTKRRRLAPLISRASGRGRSWFGQGPDGASRASTNPSDAITPRTKLSGLRQTGTRFAGRDACKSSSSRSANRHEKRIRPLAQKPWRGLPWHPAQPPSRVLQRGALALCTTSTHGGLHLGQSCHCRPYEMHPTKSIKAYSTMRTGGQVSRARLDLITRCPTDALGSIGTLSRCWLSRS